MTSVLEYVHKDLTHPDDSVRLLELQPGSFDSPLRCSILVHPLDEPCNYEALSYVWGEDEKVENIYVQESTGLRSIGITRNLSLALRRIRNTSEPRIIWTDAICINPRKDSGERGIQVRLMTRIYQDAQVVLAYLGEADESSDMALELIDQLAQAFLSTPTDDTRRPQAWTHDHNFPNHANSSEWLPLQKFFCRPWFRRMWITQEIVVSRRAKLLCGTWIRDWSILQAAHSAIMKYGMGAVNWTVAPALGISQDHLQRGLCQLNYIRMVKDLWQRDVKLSLMELLYIFQSAQAGNELDYIFALLGLACDTEDERLDPNYDEQTTVIANAERYARYFLQELPEKRRLEVLYRAGLESNCFESGPTWIPNWYGNYPGYFFEYCDGVWHPYLRPSWFNIAPNTKPEIVGFPNAGEVTLKGIKIDVIRDLALRKGAFELPLEPSLSDFLEAKRIHLQNSDRIIQRFSTYPTGENISTVYWRTLICNVTKQRTLAPDDMVDSYQAWRRTCGVEQIRASGEDFVNQEEFSFVLDNFNLTKTFGSTENGYVGMFPKKACIGDFVYVFHGGHMPFVLRTKDEAESKYQLVGQCYIHGIMDGSKGFDLDPAGDITLV